AYSKFLWSFKLETKEAAGIVQCLHYSFRMFGVPLSIQADNGKEFKNASMRSFAHELNIQIYMVGLAIHRLRALSSV
ncbi:hypothetical protein ENBRE01_1987, partial [Enteropsectra breve]